MNGIRDGSDVPLLAAPFCTFPALYTLVRILTLPRLRVVVDDVAVHLVY